MSLYAGALLIGRNGAQRVGDHDYGAELALIERCKKNDERAFGQFVDQYQARVFGFVRRMVVDVDEAADITQDVFIRAFQNFSRFDARSSVKTWLFRIAQNLCIDFSRKQSRTPSTVALSMESDADEALEIWDDHWSPEQIAMDSSLMDRVNKAIESMSEKLRSVLILHDREDMAYEEIAEALAIPVGTVKSRLFLARSYLQRALQGDLAEFREPKGGENL